MTLRVLRFGFGLAVAVMGLTAQARAGGLTAIASFDDTNGSYPYGGATIDSAGNLYGTTLYSGGYGVGTVWEITKGSTTITTLLRSTVRTATILSGA